MRCPSPPRPPSSGLGVGYPTLKQVAEAGPGASVSSRKSMLTDDLLKKINDCVYRKW